MRCRVLFFLFFSHSVFYKFERKIRMWMWLRPTMFAIYLLVSWLHFLCRPATEMWQHMWHLSIWLWMWRKLWVVYWKCFFYMLLQVFSLAFSIWNNVKCHNNNNLTLNMDILDWTYWSGWHLFPSDVLNTAYTHSSFLTCSSSVIYSLIGACDNTLLQTNAKIRSLFVAVKKKKKSTNIHVYCYCCGRACMSAFFSI